MKTLFGLLILLALFAAIIGFIVFIFSVHWSLGVIAILLVLGKII